MQSMVVTRVLATSNLLLDGNSHYISILNLQLAHRPPPIEKVQRYRIIMLHYLCRYVYENLDWLSDHQQQIEQSIFTARYPQQKPQLFLYDVTSSYLEGEQNPYGAYGYRRDGKKNQKQI